MIMHSESMSDKLYYVNFNIKQGKHAFPCRGGGGGMGHRLLLNRGSHLPHISYRESFLDEV